MLICNCDVLLSPSNIAHIAWTPAHLSKTEQESSLTLNRILNKTHTEQNPKTKYKTTKAPPNTQFFYAYIMTEFQYSGVLLFHTAALTVHLKELKLELAGFNSYQIQNTSFQGFLFISEHSFLTFCFSPHSHSVKFLLLLPQQCLLLNL